MGCCTKNAASMADRTCIDLLICPCLQASKLAEGISKKEIGLKLGRGAPKPSKQEQALAEGISQKEIAVKLGQDEAPTAKPAKKEALSTRGSAKQACSLEAISSDNIQVMISLEASRLPNSCL